MVGEHFLQIERAFVVDIAVVQCEFLEGVVLGEADCEVLQSFRTESVVAEVELEDRHHVFRVEGVAEVAAADGGDLVRF